MKFIKSDGIKISLHPDQLDFISSAERIREAVRQENVLAYDIYQENVLIGFAMLRCYGEGRFFLWNYAIDAHYQNHGFGTKALHELLEMLKKDHQAMIVTTTVVQGNDTAMNMYRKAGFIITDTIDEDDIHETNLLLVLTEVQSRTAEKADETEIKTFTDQYGMDRYHEYEEKDRHVILNNDRIIGWYILYKPEETIQSGYIYIYLKPEYRRRGIGQKIYYHCVPELTSAADSWWTDYAESEGSDAFCRYVGFDEINANCLLKYDGKYEEVDHSCIRKYHDGDFEAASGIWDREYNRMKQEIGEESSEHSNDREARRRIYHRNRDNIFVAEADGKVIGCGQLFEDNTGIGSLAVDREYQNQGYGRKILSYLVRECIRHGNEHPLLYCEPKNAKAMNLYLSSGFQVIRTDHYAVKRLKKGAVTK